MLQNVDGSLSLQVNLLPVVGKIHQQNNKFVTSEVGLEKKCPPVVQDK